ncbi:MAG: agmatine deiminase family protein [Spirochaetales bacterium]|nr:agmatine deiminase family protein [Spirochaetales bacterium]
MKKRSLLILTVIIVSVFPYFLIAQNRVNLSGPPTGPVRNIAEFEPMEGVLIAYSGDFGIPYFLISELSKDVIVMTIVGDSSAESFVRSEYSSNNVVLANCEFVEAQVDSYYTRDYGPFFIANYMNETSIVDISIFYAPNDNAIPVKMSEVLGVDSYFMDLVIQGGNYMTDGMGIAASTRVVLEDNPALDEAGIRQLVSDYLNISTYHLVEDPNATHIDHIDCWGKFLSVDTILIREVAPSDPQYQKIEETVAYFRNAVSSYGTPYDIIRINTPNDEPYTNSLIINDKVFVPVVGSPNDTAALQTYFDAMPGYRIYGVTPNHNEWNSSDALHCRTKGIPDRNMIHINHMPLSGIQADAPGYTIAADIVSYAGEVIYADDVKLFYSQDNGPFTSVTMQNVLGSTYSGTIIPVTGTEIAYYISAADAMGRTYTLPYIGEPDPFRFIIEKPVPTPTPDPGIVPGDVNSDGMVDIVDALLVSQFYVGLDPAGFNQSKADTNCDGSIDIIDALLIAQFYVGLITNFC